MNSKHGRENSDETGSGVVLTIQQGYVKFLSAVNGNYFKHLLQRIWIYSSCKILHDVYARVPQKM